MFKYIVLTLNVATQFKNCVYIVKRDENKFLLHTGVIISDPSRSKQRELHVIVNRMTGKKLWTVFTARNRLQLHPLCIQCQNHSCVAGEKKQGKGKNEMGGIFVQSNRQYEIDFGT